MNKFLLITLICFFSLNLLQAQSNSPCNDSLYLKLKAKGIENLTEDEISYLSQKENECKVYNNSNKIDNSKIAAADQMVQQKRDTEQKNKRDRRNYKTRTAVGKLLWLTIVFGGL
jgi:ribosomal protein L16 Arg81 hydroxylase